MRSKLLDEEIKRRDDEAKNKKLSQWNTVKEKAPEIANFMIEINKAFGKPAFVKVELNSGEVILDSSK
ncbi:MAG: hypothetical protein WC790_02960 [Candidatus Paceibacterota bacterium]|jgi:hypothetical protein